MFGHLSCKTLLTWALFYWKTVGTEWNYPYIAVEKRVSIQRQSDLKL